MLTAFVICLTCHATASPAQVPSVPYTWKSVRMVGGGFVDGIVFHPKAKGLCYARTDIGGAYRRDSASGLWQPLLDWVPFEDLNFMGVESIGLDANDPNRLYLACGTYSNPETPNAAILRSSDRGKSFQITRMPFKMGGNENGRGAGERLMVDPCDGRVVYFGSRHDGLWRSNNRGVTWERVESFPEGTTDPNEARLPAWQNPNVGVITEVFDPTSGAKGKPCTTIFAAACRMSQPSIFRSTDAGRTWQPVPGQPTKHRPTHMVRASDGAIYVTYGTDPGPVRMRDGAVWKLKPGNGGPASFDRWTEITPDRPDPASGRLFGYAAVSVDAKEPKTLIVSSFFRPGGEDIFRTRDGGKTWKQVFHGGVPGVYDHSKAPYNRYVGIHWLFDIEIDPFYPDHAIFTTGYGGHETFDLLNLDKGKPTTWYEMATGIEETVSLEIVAPKRGAALITAIGDYGGFVHWDLDKAVAEGNFDNPHFGNTDSVAAADDKPEVIVRVGGASGSRGGGNVGFSLDGGQSWKPTASVPFQGARGGRIAVSADGSTWVWTLRNGAYRTADKGATWNQCSGLPAAQGQVGTPRVLADRVDPKRFWSLALFEGKLFLSQDGGGSFAERSFSLPGGLPKRGGDRMDGRAGQDRLYVTPDREGDLWIAAFDGLFRSTDIGKSFAEFPAVSELHAFGFGKAAPGSTYPTLFMIGVVQGVRGVFRSTDEGTTWHMINDAKHQWGLLLQITGDPRVFGRVYVGTHGRGVLYGDPLGR